jgi:hypothetical protein
VSRRRIFKGSCHCGAVTVTFETAIPPEAMEIRACQCSFCRRQGSEAMSDPSGRLEIRSAAGELDCYRFGHGRADYLRCARCGVYLGAVTAADDGLRGFILARILDESTLFTRKAVAVSFGGEPDRERQSRRSAKWTPAALVTLPGAASAC